MANKRSRVAQHMCCCDREVKGKFCRDIAVRETTYAISSKESSHGGNPSLSVLPRSASAAWQNGSDR